MWSLPSLVLLPVPLSKNRGSSCNRKQCEPGNEARADLYTKSVLLTLGNRAISLSFLNVVPVGSHMLLKVIGDTRGVHTTHSTTAASLLSSARTQCPDADL